jgi:carbohydrate diacid regulator
MIATVSPPATAGSLTADLAQRIAGETSAIVGYNILITDTDGIVIGSGDTSRVGSFHEASIEVVQTGQPATHSAAQARVLRGVKPGVTLPILLNGLAVGTVGITGSPGQVTRLGLMVERQTEILLNEALLLRSRLLHERVLEELVRDLVAFDPDVIDAEPILDRAKEQGVDLSVPRAVIVLDVLRRSGTADGLLANAIRLLRESFADQQNVAVATTADRFVVLARLGRGGVAEAVRLARACVELFKQRLGVDVAIGIGTRTNALADLRTSYEDAADALRLGARSSIDRVAVIDDVRVAQLVASVGHRRRERYASAVAAGLRDLPDWPSLRDTVIAWCDSGFSLVRAAAMLHVHRNTLVYRLEKIEQRQGWSGREPHAYLALYLACIADQFDR